MAHLAQLNLARLKAPKGNEITAEFFAAIPPINALAEAQPGFVWRLVGDVKDHTDIEFFLDPLMVVNLSVWDSLQSFRHFVYKTGHVQYIKRKKEWFREFEQSHAVLWWINEGHRPDLSEAKKKWELLKEQGPGPEAFSLNEVYPEPTRPPTAL